MIPYLQDPDVTLYHGDALEILRELPAASVHMVCTSPPFYGLRDYGHDQQIGLEETPDAYITRLVEVFREVRRVLRDDGTLWVEIGDSYNSQGTTGAETFVGNSHQGYIKRRLPGLKHKDLIGAPWLLAFALRADGWYLRSEIIWAKPNPMPESVTDRPTTSHSRVFLLTKSARYFYDADAIRETGSNGSHGGLSPQAGAKYEQLGEGGPATSLGMVVAARNRRSVWEIATEPYAEAHFATWPTKLVEPMILAGCPEGGTVLDCFGGSGTTAHAARKHGRRSILVELNAEYCKLAASRLAQLSLLATEGTES